MIVTLTPNPSLDRTVEIDQLNRGAVLRATNSFVTASGKGINVALSLQRNGTPCLAVAPSGGAEGIQFQALLEATSLEFRLVPVQGAVRENISAVERDGTTTKLNSPGPELSGDEADALFDAVLEAAGGASWVACCGSLPPGAPPDLYARVVAAVHKGGGLAAVDSSGPALAAALPACPDLIKPNDEELAELVGRDLPTLGDAAAAAEELLEGGTGAVLISLGADGALLVAPGVRRYAPAPAVTVRGTAGAGDALLSGFLHAIALSGGASGGGHPQGLADAVCWAAASCRLPGTGIPGPDDLDDLHTDVTDDIPLTLKLKGT